MKKNRIGTHGPTPSNPQNAHYRTDVPRMDIQYHAIRLLFENKPFYAPVGDKPERIIDFGTGTGKFLPTKSVLR